MRPTSNVPSLFAVCSGVVRPLFCVVLSSPRPSKIGSVNACLLATRPRGFVALGSANFRDEAAPQSTFGCSFGHAWRSRCCRCTCRRCCGSRGSDRGGGGGSSCFRSRFAFVLVLEVVGVGAFNGGGSGSIVLVVVAVVVVDSYAVAVVVLAVVGAVVAGAVVMAVVVAFVSVFAGPWANPLF